MKNLFFILIVCIGLYSCDKASETDEIPNEIVPFDNFKNEEFLITDQKLSAEEKMELLEPIWSDYSYYIESNWAENGKKLIDCFSFIELNQDNKLDLIFRGWSGGEPDCFRIYLSNKNGFDKPIEYLQYLKSMDVKDGKLLSIVALDFGCCAEYVEQEIHYEFDEDIKPRISIHRARIGKLKDNYKIFVKPYRIEVQNEVYKLRGEPTIQDKGTFIYDYYDKGNTLTLLPKGSKGTVWAIDKNDPKREWLYVEMDPITEKLEFDMYDYYHSSKLRRFGWMSGRYLKRIE